MTDGGDGTCGNFKPKSEDHKRNLSKSLTGKKYKTGRKSVN